MTVGPVEFMRGYRWWWLCFRVTYGPGYHTVCQGPPWKLVGALVYCVRRYRRLRAA